MFMAQVCTIHWLWVDLRLVFTRGRSMRRVVLGVRISILRDSQQHSIVFSLVSSTEVCGLVLSEKNGFKCVKTLLLLSNVIDVDHLIGVLARFHA